MGGRADSSRVDQHQKLEIMDWKGSNATVRQGKEPQVDSEEPPLDRENNHT